MSNQLSWRCVSIGLALVGAAAIHSSEGLAQAQMDLPGVTVTAASPVEAASGRLRSGGPSGQGQGESQPQLPTTPLIVDDVFVPLTLVPEREIVATPGANLADSLQYRPGIAGSTFTPGANRPVIRGLDNYRVRVQENGIGSHDVSALSEDHAVPIDPFAADQIEVVRGPATLRYGSQAIGGVVSASNDRIPEFIPRRGFTAAIKGGLGSVDGSADGAFKVTAGAGNFAVHADAFKRHAGDYDTPHGRHAELVRRQRGLLGRHVLCRPAMASSASRSPATTPSTASRPSARIAHRHEAGQDAVARRMARERRRHRGDPLLVRHVGLRSTTRSRMPTGDVGSLFTNKEHEGARGGAAPAGQTAFGELRGAVGMQFGHRNVQRSELRGRSLLEPAKTRSLAAFWFEELQVTKTLRLQAAARIEQAEVGRHRRSTDPTTSRTARCRGAVPSSRSAPARASSTSCRWASSRG